MVHVWAIETHMVRTSSSVAAFATTFKQWEGVSFHPSDKFVLRMKFLRNDQFLGKPVSDYYVTITRSGRNDAEGCVSGDVNKTIYVNPNGVFQCSTGLGVWEYVETQSR